MCEELPRTNLSFIPASVWKGRVNHENSTEFRGADVSTPASHSKNAPSVGWRPAMLTEACDPSQTYQVHYLRAMKASFHILFQFAIIAPLNLI